MERELAKPKGFRSIVVDGRTYYWQLTARGILKIVTGRKSSPALEVDFGWYDVWLYPPGDPATPPPFEPRIVTPEFVRAAVVTGIQAGWGPAETGSAVRLVYRNGAFSRS